MHSLRYMSLVLAVGASAVVLPPAITPAPALVEERDGPDAASLALVLITAVPEEIREVAATNINAASSILWSEFLGGNRPSWFTDLPEDIQNYLINTFGPKTAAPSALPTIPSIFPSLTESAASSTFDDGQWHPSSSAGSSQASSASSPTSQNAETNSVSSNTESQQSTATDSAGSTRTTETGSISQTSSASRSSRSNLATSGLTFSTQKTAPSASSTEAPAPTSAEQGGLTRNQKIGIGLGVPLGIAGAAALLFACCFLLKRRQRKSVDGSVPPSSPGFIPRFSFQEKTNHNDIEQRPLTRRSENYHQDWSNSAWDDDVIESTPDHPLTQNNIQHQQWPVSHQQPAFAPVLAPLLHTHSSNKARGKRTSYSSLHSVAEVSEPDEVESPVLGRDLTPRNSPPRQSAARRPSVTIPPIPEAAQIKRKPIGSPPTQSPAAEIASQTLLKQTMGHQNHNPNRYGNQTSVTAASPVSPAEKHSSRNPFSNNYSYVEDYGPEYHGGYVDAVENGMFGGHTSLSRYPEPKNSKTEWPLRNSLRHKRTRSPMWDRVYDG
ncbi:hypothetical protein BDV96DRAFT_653861 [Lophiotrema nucula]|uniref:Mid2 domain-containing protein n=1 Tax=Lophiotrema nucula TaxID=690887 RepID=A0A6A5YM81_9PLEO|nr:hypothetical protein BDV96DRAFT_653861 [Lophiotrema nucula]